MKKILRASLAAVLVVLFASLNGCAGLGLDKKATLAPDEIWVSGDFDPQQSGRLSEITVGAKYKLK